jgi:hypothetical protein
MQAYHNLVAENVQGLMQPNKQVRFASRPTRKRPENFFGRFAEKSFSRANSGRAYT